MITREQWVELLCRAYFGVSTKGLPARLRELAEHPSPYEALQASLGKGRN